MKEVSCLQNRHGELTIICKAKDLVNHTLQLTNNTKLFPKKVRSPSARGCRTSQSKSCMTS